ncbi:MAG: bifunctional adenosylcobinamide kinase/adenosylcobinamide-phosphate guanylyltransferase [Deltaproteobacteria bacterium]|nr:bifunctional adenosylcobinamide kinase/adenosylcobinamide-phosphate guanylyltransferase [Deltaproteobacteria bacterium]MBW2393795.1 bifunctional adenosylcobinamide kinase/adenosylcobinamide-phosphate guanylyltransferase [Deltaproteobacteria bacterium]
MPLTLLLGGARSGKSRRAEELALAHDGPVIYVATAPEISDDPEWTARIATHRERRPASWTTLEAPLELAETLRTQCHADTFVLVDCLTLWLSNWLHAGNTASQAAETLERILPKLPGRIVMVSNEVGSGVVPARASGRRFRDAQGVLNQRVAALADRVELMVAGIPLTVKGR